MKKLPIGIQNFGEIIRDGYLYIDKTEAIHRLVTEGKLYFLSRPRRFGKSVLVSTLAALFRGERDLFRGLFIEDKWDWRARPVLSLSMLGLRTDTVANQEADLIERLGEQAAQHGVTVSATSSPSRLRELILAMAANGPVAILIDEYDKPILDQITDPVRAEANKKHLAPFYATLKLVEEHLGFLFMTGVSKFTRVSLFSDLNNLEDISLSPAFACIAGYTEAEITQNMAAYLAMGIEGLAGPALIEKMRDWYNGYTWDGKTHLYNPVSILKLFKQKRFTSFWFSTGTPKFLIDLYRNGQIRQVDLDGTEVSELIMDGFEPEKIDPIALLFQTGYLTIKDIIPTSGFRIFRMGYPNREVRDAFLTYLLAGFSQADPSKIGARTWQLGEYLRKNEIDAFVEGLRSVIASIPYNIFIDDREAYYQTAIYLVLSLIGVPLLAEIQTNKGRIDVVMETETRLYITEFKLGTAREALDQIHNHGYAEAYRNRSRDIVLLGVGIAPEKRNIEDWIAESLDTPSS